MLDKGGRQRRQLGPQRAALNCKLANRFVDDFVKARHVCAFLLWSEVDKTFELGVVGLLRSGLTDADHLLNAGYTDSRKREVNFRLVVLNVRRIA